MGKLYTDYLTATGSTLIGAASTFAVAGGFFEFNLSPTPEAADAVAIRQDFAMVGQDIADARLQLT
jgi:hypothetical protein